VKNSTCRIPEIPGFSTDDWPAIETALATGCPVQLTQHWRETLESDWVGGEIRLAHRGTELFIHAKLVDDRPSNRITVWNQRAWCEGDTLELFLWDESRENYYELHITPENQRLQLHFPDPASLKAPGKTLADWTIDESLFESRTRVNADQSGWEVFIRIDLAVLYKGFAPAQPFRFHFGRYDYQPGRAEPVLSSNAPFTVLNFHRRHEWAAAELI